MFLYYLTEFCLGKNIIRYKSNEIRENMADVAIAGWYLYLCWLSLNPGKILQLLNHVAVILNKVECRWGGRSFFAFWDEEVS